ncbi:hypothetical protein EJB05_20462, partial [Eragrostis curvula]
MASKAFALFLAVNLVVLGVANACGSSYCPPTPVTPTPVTPTPTPSSFGKCPRDALKLGVCANVLGLIKAKVGGPPALPCCSLLKGLVDLEAAVCLCTAIKANVLGIPLNLPIDLSLILNYCGKTAPTGFNLVETKGGHAPPPPPPPPETLFLIICGETIETMTHWILVEVLIRALQSLPAPLGFSAAVMASKAFLLVALNLLLFTVANACGNSCPTPPTPATPSSGGKCPKNALKLGVCANVLGLVSAEVGHPPAEPCCSILGGLADLEAAVCLCTAIKANVLGITLDIPVKLSLIVNYCGKSLPNGFICA